MLSPRRARQLKPLLDSLLDPAAMAARVAFDPVRFPRRYEREEDIEVAALMASCLAYGRAELFSVLLERLFAILGAHPAAFARDFVPWRDARRFEGLSYRFNRAADFATLVAGVGEMLQNHTTLGHAFEKAFFQSGTIGPALAAFVAALKTPSARQAIERVLGPVQGFAHLLPNPERGGACKRLWLMLRWMVRGGPDDPVDLGLWKAIPPSVLLIPLDTHIARLARCLGLTERRVLDRRTATEITESLRQIEPSDPVKYDFALCHHGMSGACSSRKTAEGCARCLFAPRCLQAL